MDKAIIEEKGGKVAGSVSNKTEALINNDFDILTKRFEGIPYYPNVTCGWDPSPRANQTDVFVNVGYPFMPVLKNNTPDEFKIQKEIVNNGTFDNYGTLTNCSATGDVHGTTCVGGLIAHSMNSGAIKSCFASGNVSGSTNCGGFIGNAYGSIEASYSTGTVTADGNTNGGFAAINYTQIKDCYSLGDVIPTGSNYIGSLFR